MKKMTLSLLVLFVTIICSAQNWGSNLVVNGDFETSNWNTGTVPPGWTLSYGEVGRFNKDCKDFISGTTCLRIGADKMGAGFYQILNLEVGATYRLGCTGRLLDMAGASGGSLSEEAKIGIAVKDVATSKVIKWFEISSNSNLPKSEEFTVLKNAQVKIELYKTGKIAYFDDIFIQKKQ